MTIKMITLALATAALLTVVPGCEDKGPLERAGERVDDAFDRDTPAENAAEEVEEAGEEIRDAVED